jgi:putative flippase GtrA
MRFVRYLTVQVVAYGLDMGGFLFFLHLAGFGPLISNVLGKVLAGLFAFFAHRAFTFKVSGAAAQPAQLLRYFLLLALNIPLSSLVLAVLLQVMEAPVLAKFATDVICVFLNYWLSKQYVFTRPATASRQREGAP